MPGSQIVPKVCLYHAECLDGTASAWVVRQRFPDIQLIPVKYHEPPPPAVDGADVYIVDFCYRYSAMISLLTRAASVTLIDHHEPTAVVIENINEWIRALPEDDDPPAFHAVFDTGASGALLTYQTLFPESYAEQGVPAIILHVSDRDIYKFAHERTRAVMHCVSMWGYDPLAWGDRLDSLYKLASAPLAGDKTFYEMTWVHGQMIESYHTEQINRMTSQTLRMIYLGNDVVPLINVPRAYSSDALATLTPKYPYALSYYDTNTHRVFSLRSRKGGVRVNDIAEQYGGGGHPGAAGFVVTRDHDLAKL